MNDDNYVSFDAFKQKMIENHVEYTEISTEEILAEFGPLVAADKEKEVKRLENL